MKQAKYTSCGKGVQQNLWPEEEMKEIYDWCRKIQVLQNEKNGEDLGQEMMIYFRKGNEATSREITVNSNQG